MWLAFGFTEKCLFTTKTVQKSVFQPREIHIPSRLEVFVLYINFWGFEKYRISTQNPKGLDFDFTKNICS
jgi:hypothetical protein